jgi:hypothetical protein
VRIVNGAGKHRDEIPDFDATPVWAILVGGTKLSRGYTVEGLTVSYYRRPTGAGDTLMQMGRWFGFRDGYRDLVRLFIGHKEKRGKTTLDLYEAFGAICRDEEALRDDLRKYVASGLKPWQVPPLVRQHLAELPPTSRNKMFNAEIKSLDFAGDWTEKTSAPTDSTRMKENRKVAGGLLKACRLGDSVRLAFKNADNEKRDFDAIMGRVDASHIRTFLSEYKWADGRRPISLEIDYISKGLADGSLREWTVLLPQLREEKPVRHVPGLAPMSTISRSRVSESRFGVYSVPMHIEAARAIAGVGSVVDPSRKLSAAVGSKTPVLVLYFVKEKNNPKAGVTVGFGIQYPGKKRTSSIQWGARRSDKEGTVVVRGA